MKRVLLVALLASLVFALYLGTMSHADAGSKPPFTGRWETIDTDESRMWLIIEPNHKYVIFDDGCTVCGIDGDGNILYRCRGRGTWTAAGNTITGDLQLWCLNPERTYFEGIEVWVYDAATETLAGGVLIWERNPGQ